jgi:hypothetical protein
MRVSAGPDAVECDAFPSFVLPKQLCGQGLPVEPAPAGLLATCRSSVHERFAPLYHGRRWSEIPHSTSECQQFLPGAAQPFPEEPVDDPCQQDSLSSDFGERHHDFHAELPFSVTFSFG